MTREIGNGESVVRGAVNKIRGKCAALGVQPAISQLGLQNAGGAGADENAHPLRAIFFGGGGYGACKAVLHQAQQREPVVTAIKVGQLRGELHVIDTRDLTRKSGQIDRIKRARRQSAALLAQRRERRLKAATDAAGCGEVGEPERVQSQTSRSK